MSNFTFYIIGPTESGKTTFFNTLKSALHKKQQSSLKLTSAYMSPARQPQLQTSDVENVFTRSYTKMEGNGVVGTVKIMDSVGLALQAQLPLEPYERVDAIFILFDSRSRVMFDDAAQILGSCAEIFCRLQNKSFSPQPCLLVLVENRRTNAFRIMTRERIEAVCAQRKFSYRRGNLMSEDDCLRIFDETYGIVTRIAETTNPAVSASGGCIPGGCCVPFTMDSASRILSDAYASFPSQAQVTGAVTATSAIYSQMETAFSARLRYIVAQRAHEQLERAEERTNAVMNKNNVSTARRDVAVGIIRSSASQN